MISGFWGLPKHKQSASESIRAPTAARLPHTSAIASSVPARGSASISQGLTSLVSASPRQLPGTGFNTAASPGPSRPTGPCNGFSAVAPRT